MSLKAADVQRHSTTHAERLSSPRQEETGLGRQGSERLCTTKSVLQAACRIHSDATGTLLSSHPAGLTHCSIRISFITRTTARSALICKGESPAEVMDLLKGDNR